MNAIEIAEHRKKACLFGIKTFRLAIQQEPFESTFGGPHRRDIGGESAGDLISEFFREDSWDDERSNDDLQYKPDYGRAVGRLRELRGEELAPEEGSYRGAEERAAAAG